MNVFEIIRWARDEGISLKVDGDRLEADSIPPSRLMAKLLTYKSLIVELLKPAGESPRRRAWMVSVSGYRFFLIGPRMTRTQALALARWRWAEAEIVD